MSASPRTKSHALRCAVSPSRPPSMDTENGSSAGLHPLLRPVLRAKQKIVPQRPPLKPALGCEVPKPASRGEGDAQRPRSSNDTSNQGRPRSSGPEACDVLDSAPRVDALSESPRPLLASDLYFELVKQEESKRMSPRVARQHNRHLYHDKMQAKYSEMRVLRARIKQLETDLQSGQTTTTVGGSDAEGSQANDANAPSPEKPTDAHLPVPRDRVLKLERHLLEAKDEIQAMRLKLDSGRTNDKALIDTLVAKLDLERAANKMLGQKVFELEAALKVAVTKLTGVELELQSERLERDVMIEQLTSMSRQAISDHRRKVINTKVKGLVSAIGKESLHVKLDATSAQLEKVEGLLQQMELEAMRWKREAMQKQAALDEYAKRGLASTSMALTQGSMLHQVDPAIAELLEHAHGTPDVVFNRALVVDGHSLFFHVVRGPIAHGLALHFVAYEPRTAQEDVLTFFAPDISRLLVDGDKYLLQPSEPSLIAELVDRLFLTLAVGFKNGTFVLAMPVTTTPIYRGSLHLQGTPLTVVVNEVCASAFTDVWSLQVRASSIEDEREWVCSIAMEQVLRVCPSLVSYKPNEARQWRLAHNIDANALILSPLFKTLVLTPTPDGHGVLASTLTGTTPLVDDTIAANAPATTITTTLQPPALHPNAPSAADRPLMLRTLLTLRGTLYYLTLRELWDASVLLDVSLYDSFTDNILQATFDVRALGPVIQCALALTPLPHPLGRLETGIPPPLRPVLAQLLPLALDLSPSTQTLTLAPATLARNVALTNKVLPTHVVTVSLSETEMAPLGVPLRIEVLTHDASLADAALGRLLPLLRRHGPPIAQRLCTGAHALVRLYEPSAVSSTRDKPSFYHVLRATTMDRECTSAWLVVQRDIPLAFVLALWRPRLCSES
ncbi:hypothetical protein SPRG_03818 [Saprolegnia parasitica CBS 223.65]|uniref:Uncharacterized protein n=1 Tax=Saprolegnia parasitica (strain CBS 223.65) TaxID=695850 RepID=A0A067CPR2_SAPPC|nr:hypothetical protein SPRG_03818 [Saprolegnia parasitica CBS 223.65]KDO31200.1 hypothetical protein SPRG_03818 [Saprolegnia parasitica CBS 223.65]|eukprot:XP_012197805.1 hypothetical protein SPRG_03818 [Saprolegnia parasitica CBS 223.65]